MASAVRKPAPKSPYADRIEEMLTELGVWQDARHVEAYIRIAHGTLDHLSPRQFLDETIIAVECVAAAGREQAERVAQSYGM